MMSFSVSISRMVAGLATVMTIAASTMVAAAGAAHAQLPPPGNQLVLQGVGMCLTGAEAAAYVAMCDETAWNQRWTFRSTGEVDFHGTQYEIVNSEYGWCLSIWEGFPATDLIQTLPCNGSVKQRWHVAYKRDGHLWLVAIDDNWRVGTSDDELIRKNPKHWVWFRW
jgi:hypothetical protein